jgi:hypothetical protein
MGRPNTRFEATLGQSAVKTLAFSLLVAGYFHSVTGRYGFRAQCCAQPGGADPRAVLEKPVRTIAK